MKPTNLTLPCFRANSSASTNWLSNLTILYSTRHLRTVQASTGTIRQARKLTAALDAVSRLGAEIMLRNATPRGEEPPPELPPEGHAMIDAQAAKRVGLEFIERHRATWDHRRLGGVY